MSKFTIEHPCLTCRLPDCNDSDSRCALRRALGDYSRSLKSGQPVPDDVRERRRIAYWEIYGSRHRELSNARYRRQTA